MEEEEVERPFLITVPLDAQKQRRLLWVTDFVLSLENMMLIDVFPRVHQFSLCKDLPEFPQIQRRAQLVALKGILTQEDPDVGRYRSFYKLFLTLGDGYDFEELELYDEFSELCALCLQFHILEVLYEDGDLEEAKELLASVDEQEGDEFLDGRLDYVERCIDSFQNRKSVTWSQKAKKDYWNLQARLLSFLDALSQNESGSVIETLPIPSNLTPKAPTPSPVFSRTKGEEENEDEEENGTLSAHDLRDAFEGSDSSFFSIIEGKDKHVARFLKDRSRPPKKKGKVLLLENFIGKNLLEKENNRQYHRKKKKKICPSVRTFHQRTIFFRMMNLTKKERSMRKRKENEVVVKKNENCFATNSRKPIDKIQIPL
mmetsp:Transcript_41924/g.58601  ORF Transcript_41924/g.58601 Transcript_41924/m.58601 type:complete len:372 (-) Transcript_41924:1676-2791(-)